MKEESGEVKKNKAKFKSLIKRYSKYHYRSIESRTLFTLLIAK